MSTPRVQHHTSLPRMKVRAAAGGRTARLFMTRSVANVKLCGIVSGFSDRFGMYSVVTMFCTRHDPPKQERTKQKRTKSGKELAQNIAFTPSKGSGPDISLPCFHIMIFFII